jgi:hypothetical protein
MIRAAMPRGMRIQAQDINTNVPGKPPPSHMEVIQNEAVTNDGGQYRGNEGPIGSARNQDESRKHEQDNVVTKEHNNELAKAFEQTMT